MLLRIYFVLFISFFMHSICGAWGAAGHKMVAEIAYSRLNKSVKDSVNKYLGYTTIAEAAVWMDEMKSNPKYDSLYPWHFIDIEKGGTFDTISHPNIIMALKKVIGELRNRKNYSKEQTEINLKILIHLIGDLHQPLHNGYPGDKGGNDIQVSYVGEMTNLHRAWDSDIIQANLESSFPTWVNTTQYSKDDMQKILHYDLIGWMNESRSYLDTIYDFQNSTLNMKYSDAAVKIIERQITVGGLRLGHLLNIIFSK